MVEEELAIYLKQSLPLRNERKISKEYLLTLQIHNMGSTEKTSEYAANNTQF